MCGSLLAPVMAIVHCLHRLPGIQKWPQAPDLIFSLWGLSSGFLSVLLVMMLWQPRSAVFLDRVCISNVDDALKRMAIYSNLAARAHFEC